MSDFYDSKEWRSVRRKRIIKDRLKCRRCRKHFKYGRRLTVHHIVPRDEGGPDALSNLISLCDPCHDEVEGMGMSRWEIENLVETSLETRAVQEPMQPVEPLEDREPYTHPGGFIIYCSSSYIEDHPLAPLTKARIVAGP